MPHRYGCLLLFGSPGVGKGTQGTLLGHIPGLCHLATGDMFRGLDQESDLGQRFHEYSTKGLLVPDEFTIELWKTHVQHMIDDDVYHPERDLLVLDGIPRNLKQAQVMDELINVLRIVHLKSPTVDRLVDRIKGRAIDQGRLDDADETVIRRRINIYDLETKPVLGHYSPARVSTISALGTPVEVLKRILDVVVPVYTQHRQNPLS